MAIYHLHAKVIQRSKGRSIVAAAAYRHACKMTSLLENQSFNYEKKTGVVHKELLLPKEAPTWLRALVEDERWNVDEQVEQLWNRVEARETRKDAQLARELELALPKELSKEQNIVLVRSFLNDQVVQRGMIADWVYHADSENPHAHVLLSLRQLTEEGFGLKVPEWNQKALLQTFREQWAAYQNYHLALHQHAVRVDHRSYQDQGIDLLPSVKLGQAVLDMERRGIVTERLQQAQHVQAENWQQLQKNASTWVKGASQGRETFPLSEFARLAKRYAPHLSTHFMEQALHVAFTEKDSSPLSSKVVSEILAGLSYHEAVFTEKDLAKGLLPFIHEQAEFLPALHQLKAAKALVYVGVGADNQPRWTTRALLNVETTLKATATVLHHRRAPGFSQKQVSKFLQHASAQRALSLTAEQKAAIAHITSRKALACLVGRAGTGKSFTLGAARALWESQGLRVRGIALSGIAAQGLHQEAGIASRTIAAFLGALQQKTLQLSARDIVVMDEAGMTDSPSLLKVLEAVQRARAKLVLVGDPQQLQPVGPGASFRALVEQVGYAELSTVYRQKIAWQREATQHLSRGAVIPALKAYQAQRSILQAPDETAALQALVADWQQQALSTPLAEMLVLTHRNQDVQRLNHALREALLKEGYLRDAQTLETPEGPLKIAKGERLLCLKNNPAYGLAKGSFGTVVDWTLDASGQLATLSLQLDHQSSVKLVDMTHYRDFTYGYAATVHKAQGVTVDHAFVYVGPSSWSRPLTYVALTRHRWSMKLYTASTLYPSFTAFLHQLNRPGNKESLLDFPLDFARHRGIESTWTAALKAQVADWLYAWQQALPKVWHALQHQLFSSPVTLQSSEAQRLSLAEIAPSDKLTLPENVDDLLMAYLQQELAQTAALQAVHQARRFAKDTLPDCLAAQNVQHQAFQAFLHAATAHPALRVLWQSLEGQRLPSLSRLGSLEALVKKAQAVGFAPETRAVLARHLQQQAKEFSRQQSHKQQEHHGRRQL